MAAAVPGAQAWRADWALAAMQRAVAVVLVLVLVPSLARSPCKVSVVGTSRCYHQTVCWHQVPSAYLIGCKPVAAIAALLGCCTAAHTASVRMAVLVRCYHTQAAGAASLHPIRQAHRSVCASGSMIVVLA